VNITEKHPFLNANGTLNSRKQLEGSYEKVGRGKYSDGLIVLMEGMINVVRIHIIEV
jgi:hypothetical protein